MSLVARKIDLGAGGFNLFEDMIVKIGFSPR